MNLTYFHPERSGNVEDKSNSPVNIRFVAKTSDIRNFSENIICDVTTSEVVTLLSACLDNHSKSRFQQPTRGSAHFEKLVFCI